MKKMIFLMLVGSSAMCFASRPERDNVGGDTLCWAANFNRLDFIRKLVHENGVSVKTKCGKFFGVDKTPLHLAAHRGNAEAVAVLVGLGAPLNARDGMECTPLHCAVMGEHSIQDKEHKQAAKILLDAKACPSLPDNEYGFTPLHCAAFTCNPAMAQILLEGGADRHKKDVSKRNPLDTAKEACPASIVREMEKVFASTTANKKA